MAPPGIPGVVRGTRPWTAPAIKAAMAARTSSSASTEWPLTNVSTCGNASAWWSIRSERSAATTTWRRPGEGGPPLRDIGEPPAAGVPRPGGQAPGWIASATLILATLILLLGTRDELHPVTEPHIPWWLLALAFAITELDGLGMVRDERAIAAPTSRIPLIVGIYLATPVGLVIGQTLGMAVAASGRWRAAPRETAFALSGSSLATTLGMWAYLLMTEQTAPSGPEGWLDGLVAGAVVVAASAVLGAVGRWSGDRSHADVARSVGRSVMTDVLAVATGLVAVEIIRTDRYAAWLLVLPASAAYVIRRQYELTDWRADALGTLHDVARRLQRASDPGDAIALAAVQARAICRAGTAHIVLRTASGAALRYTDRGAGPSLGTAVIGAEDLRYLTEVAEVSGAAVVASEPVPAARRLRGALDLLGGRRDRQTIVVPIAEYGVVTGYLRLVDRAGRGRFTPLELAVVETLAASLGVALETIHHLDELVEQQHRDARVMVRLERVNRELTEVSDAKSIFLATTSHELRAPLSAILAETEVLDHLLPRTESEDRCRRLVHGARSNARHLLRLVDDLLDLSRIEVGRLELRHDLVSLRDVAADAVEALRPAITAKDLTIGVEEAAVDTPLIGDAGRLWQVVANLVTNASNATPPGGHIEVAVDTDGRHVRLRVTDNGVGIAPDKLERMFAPFEQGPDRSRGLGLGLTIARHLVEAHGGTLDASSVPGEGSCFTASFDPARKRPHGDAGGRPTLTMAPQR